MKNYIIVLCYILVPFLPTNGQNFKKFDCGLFSFDYPTVFKPSAINNAPHMVLKLQSDSYIFSASYWDKGFSEDINIWDDNIFQLYKQNPIGEGTLVNITKETIKSKGGIIRCLKLKTNISRYIQNKAVNLKMVSYLLIHDGYLLTFAFMSEGKYLKESPTVYPDKVMQGLRIKSNKKASFDFDSYLLEVVKKLNAQCPMKVDACTMHLQVLLTGKTVMIKTLIEDSCDDLVDYNEFKKKMCENFCFALEKAFVQYLDKNGYSLSYMIYNEYDKLKKIVRISGKDILYYYH